MGSFDALDAASWLFTYLIHSTVLLGVAWIFTTRVSGLSDSIQEQVWKLALVGGLVSATLQTALGEEAPGARFALSAEGAAESGTATVGSPQADGFDPRDRGNELAWDDSPELDDDWLADDGQVASERVEDDEPLRGAPSTAPEFEPTPIDQLAEADGNADSGATPPPLQGTLGSESFLPSLDLHWSELAIGAWILGGALLALVLGRASLALFDRLRGRRALTEGPLPTLVEELRTGAGVRRRVRLAVSDRLEAPVALGVLSPQIVLPRRAVEGLTPDLQRTMLAHELAHIARLDPFWLSLTRWLEVVLFVQPLNRVAGRRLRSHAEFLCDAWAVRQTGDRVGLARCLAEVAGWILADHRPLPACGMADLRSPLGARVQRILEGESRSEGAPRATVPVAAAIVTATVLYAPGFATPVRAAIERATTVEPDPVGATPASPVATPAEPEPVPAPVVARATEPAPAQHPIGVLFLFDRDLEGELSALEAEVADIRRRLDPERVSAELNDRLTRIEDHARTLRANKDRIHFLLERFRDAERLEELRDEPRSDQR